MSSILLWMVPTWEYDIVVIYGVYAILCGIPLAIGYWGLWHALKELWDE